MEEAGKEREKGEREMRGRQAGGGTRPRDIMICEERKAARGGWHRLTYAREEGPPETAEGILELELVVVNK